jgi:hypothetical protein
MISPRETDNMRNLVWKKTHVNKSLKILLNREKVQVHLNGIPVTLVLSVYFTYFTISASQMMGCLLSND